MTTSRRRRIGVLVGGDAPERELSVRAGEAILGALHDAGRDAVLVHVDRHLDLVLRQERVEVAFLALRGRGADGAVQGLLEVLGVPYTGSSMAASALAADKLKAKELLRLHNLPTPAFYRHSRGLGTAVEQHQGFGFPCVVKPRSGGGGIGVAMARDAEELQAAIDTALRLDDEALVERMIAGMEVQVAILDGQVLGAAEVASEGGLLDWAARCGASRTRVVVPPRLSAERLRGVVALALRAHHMLGCDGLTRVDMILPERGNEQVLEVDAQPDLAPGSLLLKLAHAAGLPFPALIERLVDGARLHAGRRMRERRAAGLPFTAPDRRLGGAADPH